MRISKQTRHSLRFHKRLLNGAFRVIRFNVKWRILLLLLSSATWITPAAFAQGRSRGIGMHEAGDGTTTTGASVFEFVKRQMEAFMKSDMDAYRRTLFFESKEAEENFEYDVPHILAMKQWIDTDSEKNNPFDDIRRVELVAHPGDMGYGIYWIAWYLGDSDKPFVEPIEIAVVNHQPLAVYDLPPGPRFNENLNPMWIELQRIQRDTQRWNVDGAALARKAQLFKELVVNKTIVTEHGIEHGLNAYKNISDETMRQVYAQRDEFIAMSPAEIRELAMKALENQLLKLKGHEQPNNAPIPAREPR